MKSDRSAGRRAASDAHASTTQPNASAHAAKPHIPPPPALRKSSSRPHAGRSAAMNASPPLRQPSIPRDTPSARRSRGSPARVAVAELDPSELLQLERVDCVAEPVGEPYGAPPTKRTSGQ